MGMVLIKKVIYGRWEKGRLWRMGRHGTHRWQGTGILRTGKMQKRKEEKREKEREEGGRGREWGWMGSTRRWVPELWTDHAVLTGKRNIWQNEPEGVAKPSLQSRV